MDYEKKIKENTKRNKKYLNEFDLKKCNENVYSLLICKYMYDRFKERGIPVKMTRDTDVTLSPRERVNKVKSFYGDGKDVVVISNHLNAGGRACEECD